MYTLAAVEIAAVNCWLLANLNDYPTFQSPTNDLHRFPMYSHLYVLIHTEWVGLEGSQRLTKRWEERGESITQYLCSRYFLFIFLSRKSSPSQGLRVVKGFPCDLAARHRTRRVVPNRPVGLTTLRSSLPASLSQFEGRSKVGALNRQLFCWTSESPLWV